jgi:hypothetical protein
MIYVNINLLDKEITKNKNTRSIRPSYTVAPATNTEETNNALRSFYQNARHNDIKITHTSFEKVALFQSGG